MITLHKNAHIPLLIAAVLLLSMRVYADFDPVNPPEPNVTRLVTVGVTPAEAGKTTGAGQYIEGTSITITTTANKNYKFQHWTVNGYPFAETNTSFTYVVGDSAAAFMAHYVYVEPIPEPWVPVNPPEPYLTQHVSVDLNPLEGGYTRGTGDYTSGTEVTIKAVPYVNYALKYWTINGYDYPQTNESFTYVVGDSSVHFVGHLVEKHLLTLKTFPRAAGVSTMNINGEPISDMLLEPGKVVDLATVANTDYVFRHWAVNGYPHSTSQKYQYTMGDTTASVVAVYDYVGTGDTTMYNPTNPPEPELREDVTVVVLSADETLGTVSGGGTYPFATIDTLIATPTTGYVFRYWNDGNTESTRVIRAERDTVFIAYFGNDTVVWNDTICYGTTLQVGDSILDQSGHYEFYTTRPDGLLTWNIVNLTIWHEMSSQFEAMFCTGEPFHYEGIDYSKPGTYVRTLQNQWGCDSVVTFTLTEFPSYDTLITAAICASERYQMFGFDENISGMYVQNLQTTEGCDSIIRLDLTVYPEYDTTIVARICNGERYNLNGFDVAQAGNYVQYLKSQFGCDSIVRLDLGVDSVPIISYYDTICQGQSLKWFDMSISTSGLHYYQEPTDSIACGYILHCMNLYVRPQLSIQFMDSTFSACGISSEESLSYIVKSGSPSGYTLLLQSLVSDFRHEWPYQDMDQGIILPAMPKEVWPDHYKLIVSVRDSFCNPIDYTITLRINYESDALITQRWNDLLAVRKTAYTYYEGFNTYQWYCDGMPIEGATQSTLYKPEGLGSSYYQVEVTRIKDGVTMMTCPFIPTTQPETATLLVNPTAVSGLAPITVKTPESGKLSIINKMGNSLVSVHADNGVNMMHAPTVEGLYLIHFKGDSGKQYVQKIIVY